MRLGTVNHNGRDIPVALKSEDRLVDLSSMFPDMIALIGSGQDGLERVHEAVHSASETIALEAVDLRCPLEPVQYRDCLVFEEHLIGAFKQAEKLTGRGFDIPNVWYKQPIYYKGNRLSFIGHGQDVIWPGYADFLDVELELAIIIGKKGRSISAADAPDHIWGYTVLNDISARDAQMAEMPGQLGPAKGKDFDTGNILGPWIVTADEVPHPAALDMSVSVNGEHWGGGNSRQMYHDFARIIEHISASETLYPGEVIGSGTVGTGCGLEIGKRLNPGDRFDLTIDKIGTLSNRIVKE